MLSKPHLQLFVRMLGLLLVLAAGYAGAQEDRTPIEWEASSMLHDRSIGEHVRRLIGEVVFVHEDTRMFCDSAYLYTADNSLRAFSNIVIEVSDTVTIYGDQLFYDGNRRWAELTGNVRMVDPQMTLYTPYLEYDLEANTATYTRGGRIVDAENELTSQWGFYFADLGEFFFKDNVILVNPEYTMSSDTLKYNTGTEVTYFFGPTTIVSDENTIYCRNGWYDTRQDIASFGRDTYFTNQEQSLTGDSVYYDRNLGYGKVMGNVLIRDSIENVIITGHFAEHFEHEERSVVTLDAVLTIVADNDSLFLHADTLETIFDRDTEDRQLLAYHHVRFYRKDLQGLSDSVAYNMADSVINMFYDPVLWSDNYQITATTLEIRTTGEEVEWIKMHDGAFIVSQEADIGFNQMKGRFMQGYFRDNQLWKVEVDGNGETIFHIREDDGSLVGINKAVASHIIIFVEGAEVTGLRFIRQPDAVLYPPDELPEGERMLQNFRWLDYRRPLDKTDIFEWR